MSLHKIASRILLSSMSTMGVVGALKGNDIAKKICFLKKKLTVPEYLGECICYTTIVTGNGILYSLMTPTILCSMPLLLPYSVYKTEIYNSNNKKIPPKYGSL